VAASRASSFGATLSSIARLHGSARPAENGKAPAALPPMSPEPAGRVMLPAQLNVSTHNRDAEAHWHRSWVRITKEVFSVLAQYRTSHIRRPRVR
jgi:hypothetical protein